MKKILVLLLVCALVFSLMSMTACRQKPSNNPDNNQGDNNQGDNNQGDNNQGDNNQGDNNQGDNNQGDNTTVEPDDEPIKNGTIETPPIPTDSTDNRG